MTAPFHRRALSLSVLSLAVGLAVGLSIAGPVRAQDEDLEHKDKRTTGTGSAEAAVEAARKRREEAKNKANEQPPKYPNATRSAPSAKASAKEAKALNDLQADYQAKKYADVVSKGEALAAASTGNAYVRSYAYLLAGNAANSLEDNAKSIEDFSKAVEANGLDNNMHYQAMFNLAVLESQNERNEDAIKTIDRFLAETRTTDTQPMEVKAYALANMNRYADSAAIYEKLLEARPGDRNTLMNAVAMYQQADNNERASTLLEAGRKLGQLDGSGYQALFVGYANSEKYAQAEEVLLEGVNKGLIKPSQQLATSYAIIAQNYYAKEKVAQAIDFYKRAASVSTNGEASLNLARILRNEGRVAEAKAAAREALAKGVKKPKDAEAILAVPGGK